MSIIYASLFIRIVHSPFLHLLLPLSFLSPHSPPPFHPYLFHSSFFPPFLPDIFPSLFSFFTAFLCFLPSSIPSPLFPFFPSVISFPFSYLFFFLPALIPVSHYFLLSSSFPRSSTSPHSLLLPSTGRPFCQASLFPSSPSLSHSHPPNFPSTFSPSTRTFTLLSHPTHSIFLDLLIREPTLPISSATCLSWAPTTE